MTEAGRRTGERFAGATTDCNPEQSPETGGTRRVAARVGGRDLDSACRLKRTLLESPLRFRGPRHVVERLMMGSAGAVTAARAPFAPSAAAGLPPVTRGGYFAGAAFPGVGRHSGRTTTTDSCEDARFSRRGAREPSKLPQDGVRSMRAPSRPRGVSNEKQSQCEVLADRSAQGADDRRSRARPRRGRGDPAAPVHAKSGAPVIQKIIESAVANARRTGPTSTRSS